MVAFLFVPGTIHAGNLLVRRAVYNAGQRLCRSTRAPDFLCFGLSRQSAAPLHIMPSLNNPHPGAYLQAQFLTPLNFSASQLAEVMNTPVDHLLELLSGRRALDFDMAYRLSYFVGDTPEQWMCRQTVYDLRQAPISVFSGPKLESAYWGKGVGVCRFEASVTAGTQVRGLAAATFSPTGQLKLVLGDVGTNPTTHFFDYAAVSVVQTLRKNTPVTLIHGDAAGFAYAQERIRQAFKAIAPSEAFLENLSNQARIQWLDYGPNRAHAGLVRFHKNAPAWPRVYREHDMVSELGRPTLDALHAAYKAGR